VLFRLPRHRKSPLIWLVGFAAAWLGLPAAAAAHGYAPPPESWISLLLTWQLEAHVLLPLLAALLLYRWAFNKVNAAHPNNPMPRWRAWSWYGGLFALLIALASPIAVYDTTLFSVHMVQHLLLVMVAAPLLVLAAPITLTLRVSSPETRKRIILPILHSRPVRFISFPVVTWVLFAGVMWASHFSPLFDASLDNEPIHVFEHFLYLATALLFWWPVVGADPSPWRLPHPARLGYLFLGMPQSSFLGLAIITAPAALYAHYETLDRSWGPTPLVDQQIAGAIMWLGGDMMFLIALLLALWVWLRAEEAEGRRIDAQLDREAARKATREASATSAQAAAPAQPPVK
jgi:putative membrane protein